MSWDGGVRVGGTSWWLTLGGERRGGARQTDRQKGGLNWHRRNERRPE